MSTTPIPGFAGTEGRMSVPLPRPQQTLPPHLPPPSTNFKTTTSPHAKTKKWVDFVAGGSGGMTAALLTAPLDVLRTRMQSDFYRRTTTTSVTTNAATSAATTSAARNPVRETLRLLTTIQRIEGTRALFRGLGPTMIGLVPSSAIKFLTYGAVKREVVGWNGGVEGAGVHLVSAAVAGGTVCTVMCPVWVVKTRVQVDRVGDCGERRYRGAIDCLVKILKGEGWRGLYRGLGASYLGVGESVVHWVLYERVKRGMREREERLRGTGREKGGWERVGDVVGWVGAAAGSKLVAGGLAYPHEVLRTRLRQAPMENGTLKYTGVAQCARLIVTEEGVRVLYGGLTPHLLRAVPSTAIIFGVYEVVMGVLATERE